jgi:cytochrome c
MTRPRSADATGCPFGAATRTVLPRASRSSPYPPFPLPDRRAAARVARVFALATLVSLAAAPCARADDAAVESLMKKSNCFKCHAIDKKKDGPSFRETAAKYKGKADAEEKLYVHLTTNPKVKVDGKEESHDSLKTKDDAQIREVIKWILSR